MMLYMKPGCPFCGKVLAWLDAHNKTLPLRDVTAGEEIVQELIERGGKRQIPFLFDAESQVALYESDAIIAHLEQVYA